MSKIGVEVTKEQLEHGVSITDNIVFDSELNSMAVGIDASISDSENAIQIGAGSNNDDDTVQINSTKILNEEGKIPTDSLECAEELQDTLDYVSGNETSINHAIDVTENVTAQSLQETVDYVDTNEVALTHAIDVTEDITGYVSISQDSVGIIGTPSATDSIAIGKNSSTRLGESNSVSIGVGNDNRGSSSVAIGQSCSIANNDNVVTIGTLAGSSSDDSVVIGHSANALSGSDNSIAIGYNASTEAQNAVQIGSGNNAVANSLKFRGTVIVGANGKIPSSSIEGGGGGGTTDYTDLTNKPTINSVTLSGNKTGAELGLFDAPLIFTNVSATFTANSDTGYEDYDYKAVLTCQGLTASMLATVIFSEEQATSGNYALTCVTGTDSVTIYSNDNTAITIPSIIAGSPVEVEAEYNAKHSYSTSEQVVGTWINGKPLYERTIVIVHPNINGVTDLYDVATNIPDYDFGFISEIMQLSEEATEKNACQVPYGRLHWSFNMSGTSRYYAFGINRDVIRAKGDTANFENLQWIFVIRYTKTTDEAVTV